MNNRLRWKMFKIYRSTLPCPIIYYPGQNPASSWIFMYFTFFALWSRPRVRMHFELKKLVVYMFSTVKGFSFLKAGLHESLFFVSNGFFRSKRSNKLDLQTPPVV